MFACTVIISKNTTCYKCHSLTLSRESTYQPTVVNVVNVVNASEISSYNHGFLFML